MHLLEELPRAWKRPDPRELALHEDLRAAVADPLPVRALAGQPRHLGEDLVTSHSDEPPHLIELGAEPELLQRIDPGARVRVVAVDQRAIDIEYHAANGCHRGL